MVGDITYLPTPEGWLYPVTVIDLHNREVIGHAMADHMRAELVRDALDLAVRRDLISDDAIFHADRGTQYTSGLFRSALAGHGIRPSVGRTGSCFDNAVAESFFATLKIEIGTTVRGHPRRRPTRRLLLPRLLQPRPSTFDTRLPHPARSPYRLSSMSHPRGMKSGVRFSGTTSVQGQLAPCHDLFIDGGLLTR
ncbi:hypothetical protein GCM10010185_55290 [Saccharothrix coeruleofusca]|uniref:Integrase catalytic domain-containing protein n=1 Tax=Saccharothrix coeruleofusca TaxID=33919 RepID=A0A918EGN7_9PSEU|nr:hypothetical protein GCM10010185_55290 [Saccharothrix coeruleofusca]